MALSDNKEKIRTLLNGINNLPNAGGGGNATWAGLPDKPVVMAGGDTLTWDGNTEGKVSPMEGAYKVSNAVPTLNDFSNGLIAIVQGAEVKVTASEVGELLHEGVIAGGGFFIVPTEIVGTDWNGIVFPEAGTYFVEGVCSSLTILGYTGFGQEKIAPSHLWQPDWNQNDSAKPDFIKNRPFGDRLEEIMPDTEFVGEYFEEGIYGILIPEGVNIETQHELLVTFDGVEYVCGAVNNGQYYGNGALLGGEDTGEPFVIVPSFNVIAVEDTEPHRINIVASEPIKLPDKYYDAANYCFIKFDGVDKCIYVDSRFKNKMTYEQLQALPKNKPLIVRTANEFGVNNAIAWTAILINAATGAPGHIVIYSGGDSFNSFFTAEYTGT